MTSPWQQLRHGAKRVAYAVAPAAVQRAVDQQYYRRRLRKGTLTDEPELHVLRRFVAAGDVVADVGANLRAYTLEMARIVGPAGRVLSLEPVPRTFELLSTFLRREVQRGTVELFPAAAGAEAGRARMHLPVEGELPNYYVASLFPIHEGATTEVEVDVVTLDSLRDRTGRRFSFLKVDVEGAELLVLRGAARILREDRPALLCEIGHSARDGSHDAANVERWLVDRGYGLHQLVGTELVPSSPTAPCSSSANFFALPGR